MIKQTWKIRHHWRVSDEMVSEVKKQAMLEVRQAVTAAEMKANDLVQQERLKMERSVEQARQLAKEEAMKSLLSQSESQEVSRLENWIIPGVADASLNVPVGCRAAGTAEGGQVRRVAAVTKQSTAVSSASIKTGIDITPTV